MENITESSKENISIPEGTANHTLCYSGSDLFRKGYKNPDWTGDRDHRKSRSDFAFLLNGGTISWKIKKKTCTTLSTTESGFVSCASLYKMLFGQMYCQKILRVQ